MDGKPVVLSAKEFQELPQAAKIMLKNNGIEWRQELNGIELAHYKAKFINSKPKPK